MYYPYINNNKGDKKMKDDNNNNNNVSDHSLFDDWGDDVVDFIYEEDGITWSGSEKVETLDISLK